MNSSGAWLTTSSRRRPLITGVITVYVAAWTGYGLATGAGHVFPYLAWMVLAGDLVVFVDSRVRFSTYAPAR